MVCFQVDIPLAYIGSGYNRHRIGGFHQFYHCVVIRREARIVPNSQLKVRVLNALVAKHEKDPAYDKIDEDLPAYKAYEVIEIKPKTISAKSDLHQQKSNEERLAVAKYLKARGWPKAQSRQVGMSILRRLAIRHRTLADH